AEHRRPGQRQVADRHEVPVIGLAVLGRILAHRRHHDAVGKRQAAQLDRGKQGAHVQVSGWRGVRCRNSLCAAAAITNSRTRENFHRGAAFGGTTIYATAIYATAVHSTNVNCSISVRWSIEKLSSETSLSTVSPS